MKGVLVADEGCEGRWTSVVFSSAKNRRGEWPPPWAADSDSRRAVECFTPLRRATERLRQNVRVRIDFVGSSCKGLWRARANEGRSGMHKEIATRLTDYSRRQRYGFYVYVCVSSRRAPRKKQRFPIQQACSSLQQTWVMEMQAVACWLQPAETRDGRQGVWRQPK